MEAGLNRRDFDTLSRALKDSRPPACDATERAGWAGAVEGIADALQGAAGCNGFDREMFLKRAGYL